MFRRAPRFSFAALPHAVQTLHLNPPPLRPPTLRAVNALARKTKALKEGDTNLAGDHVREGLAAVVAVRVPAPEFEGQTKTRLGNPEVRRLVEGVVAAGAGEALELDPATFAAVLAKATQAARAAEAAKKARELVRRKVRVWWSGVGWWW